MFAVGSINYGAIALGGACILMITGCMDSKAAFHNANWTSIVITGCSLSFATALDKSGGGEMITNAIIGRLGGEMASPFWIFAVFTALAALLTSVMSNTSVVALFTPIGISLAFRLGVDPMLFVTGAIMGAAGGFLTPMCAAPLTITLSCGYRFRDYVVVGGAVTAVTLLCTIGFSWLVYG